MGPADGAVEVRGRGARAIGMSDDAHVGDGVFFHRRQNIGQHRARLVGQLVCVEFEVEREVPGRRGESGQCAAEHLGHFRCTQCARRRRCSVRDDGGRVAFRGQIDGSRWVGDSGASDNTAFRVRQQRNRFPYRDRRAADALRAARRGQRCRERHKREGDEPRVCHLRLNAQGETCSTNAHDRRGRFETHGIGREFGDLS